MFKRILIYLNEMFPITAIIGSVISAVAVELVYMRLYGIAPSWSYQLLIPGLVLALISLLIRVMDEFKDYLDDLRNFPERPLPSGRVKASDLKVLGFFCVLASIFLSATSKPLILWNLLTLCFTGLMLKWFFIEDIMRKNLPLAFITHHPIVIFNFVYIILACMEMNPAVGYDKWYFVLPLCLMYTNWEVMRKIRAPEQETSYTTYSKIFGPRVAMTIALVLQLSFNAAVYAIFHQLGTNKFIQLAYGLLQLIFIYPCVRFLFTLKLKAPLKPNAESQILLVIGALMVAALT